MTPRQTDILTFSDGSTALCCGQTRNAIRAPYRLGLTAHAYLRWQQLAGAVIIDRYHLYFLVTPPTPQQWRAIEHACHRHAPTLRALGHGSIIAAPTPGSRWRWLTNNPHTLADPHDVLAALAIASRKHATGHTLAHAARHHILTALARRAHDTTTAS